jgi:hypothetical protein
VWVVSHHPRNEKEEIVTERAALHISRAKVSIERSDAALMEAATEILKAMEADATLTLERVGVELGRSADWVSALLR